MTRLAAVLTGVLTLGPLVASLTACGPPAGKTYRVGYLTQGPVVESPADQRIIDAFTRGLRELGDAEGRNLQVEWREASGHNDAALLVTADLREITLGEHPHFRIATDGDRGVPVGIDVRRAVEIGIMPLINTGIADRRAGTGQVGAGTVRAPLGYFTAALEALARSRGVA